MPTEFKLISTGIRFTEICPPDVLDAKLYSRPDYHARDTVEYQYRVTLGIKFKSSRDAFDSTFEGVQALCKRKLFEDVHQVIDRLYQAAYNQDIAAVLGNLAELDSITGRK
jgi:hypothetical protein